MAKDKQRRIAFHMAKLKFYREKNNLSDEEFQMVISGQKVERLGSNAVQSIRKHYFQLRNLATAKDE